MTVIMAIPVDGKVYMAADGRSTVHDCHVLRATNPGKIVLLTKPEPLAIGVTGSQRITQEIAYRWKAPATLVANTDRALFKLLDSLQRHLLSDDVLSKLVGDKDDGTLDAEMVLAFRGRTWSVFGDFCALEDTERGFSVLGSAMDVAFGVLAATRGQEPDKRLLMALEAAAEFHTGVGPPWQFVTLDAHAA